MRLPAGVPGRMLVTDLLGSTTTWLDGRHLLSATATPTLNGPCQITGDVRSSDPAVNVIYEPDGNPLVAQSNRLVYMFLRYGLPPDGTTPVDPWNLVASGILMSPQDQADSDIGSTHFTAYDGWQWLMGQPVFLDAVGSALPPGGAILTGPGNVIAMTALGNTLNSLIFLGATGPGFGAEVPGFGLVDLPDMYGGAASSGFWAGVNETTPTIAVQAQQGMMIGDLFTQLTSLGGDVTGTSQCIDIWLKPIYDPVNRPGYVSEINIFNLMGQERPGSAFSWSRFNRTAITADRQHDGTPGSLINVANFFAGQGGWPVLPIPNDDASIVANYSYWSQQFFADQFANGDAVLFLANQALTLYKQGKRTFAVDPDPMRAPRPTLDYQIGDRVPIYAPGARPFGTQPYGLRAEAAGYQRVQAIPIQLNADGVTVVSKLLTSPDWPQSGATLSDLEPVEGVAGTTGVKIYAFEFLPFTVLTMTVGGVAATITSGDTTNDSGNTLITFTVPGSLADGPQAIIVTDGVNTVTSPTPFLVSSSPPPVGNTRAVYDFGNHMADYPTLLDNSFLTLITDASDTAFLSTLFAAGMNAWAKPGIFTDGAFTLDDSDAVAEATAAVATGAVTALYIADEPPASAASLVKARANLLAAACPGTPIVFAYYDYATVADFYTPNLQVALDIYPSQHGFDYSLITQLATAAGDAGFSYYGVIGAFAAPGYPLPTSTQLQAMFDTWAATAMLGWAIYAWGPTGGTVAEELQNQPDLLNVIKAN